MPFSPPFLACVFREGIGYSELKNFSEATIISPESSAIQILKIKESLS